MFVTSKCHKRWNKERSSLCLRQLEEALCCAVNAFGNNCQQGKVFSFWFSWAWGLKDMKLSQVIINTPATCTRWDHWSQWHRPWCLGNTLSNGPAISPQHHTPLTSLQQGFLHLFIWMLDSPESVYTENQYSPLVASTRNWKRTGHMMARTQCPGKGLDHSIQCVCYGNKGIVSPGEGRQGEKMLFHSWRYLKCLKPSDRVVACCADRSQHVDMTCITTAKRFPKTREKVSILSAGLTLLSNALMLNQSNWVWAQQKSMRSLSSPMSNTHTLTSLPKRFSYYPLWTKILNVFIQFLQKVLLYLLLISMFRTLWKPTEHLSCQDYMCATHKYLKITDVIQKILPE